MLKAIADFFGASRYSEHAICLTNDPLIMSLYVASDMIIFISFIVISAGLFVGWRQKQSFHLSNTQAPLFATFIFLCAMTHFTGTIVIFSGLYRLDVAVRATLAAVAAVTAITALLEVRTEYEG